MADDVNINDWNWTWDSSSEQNTTNPLNLDLSLFGDSGLSTSLGWLTDPNAKPYLDPSNLGIMQSIANLNNIDIGGLDPSAIWDKVKGFLGTKGGATAASLGLAALLNKTGGGSGQQQASGYQGRVPLYTASRQQLQAPAYTPYAQFTPGSTSYRPGQGGINYFSPIKYTDTGIEPAKAQEFLGGIGALGGSSGNTKKQGLDAGSDIDANNSIGLGQYWGANTSPDTTAQGIANIQAGSKNIDWTSAAGQQDIANIISNSVNNPMLTPEQRATQVAQAAQLYGFSLDPYYAQIPGLREAAQKTYSAEELGSYNAARIKNTWQTAASTAPAGITAPSYEDYAKLLGSGSSANYPVRYINKNTGEVWTAPSGGFTVNDQSWVALPSGNYDVFSTPERQKVLGQIAPSLSRSISYIDQLIAKTDPKDAERLRYLTAEREGLIRNPESVLSQKGQSLYLAQAIGEQSGGRGWLPEYAQWLPYEKVLQAYTTDDPRSTLQYFNREAAQGMQMPAQYYDVIGTIAGMPVTKQKISGTLSIGGRSIANPTTLTDAIEYFGLTADEINQLDKVTQGQTGRFSDISDMFSTFKSGWDPAHAAQQDAEFAQFFGRDPYASESSAQKAEQWNKQLESLGLLGTDAYTGGLTADAIAALRQSLTPKGYAVGGNIVMNQGGLASLAQGGRYIQGPGDGVSDDVPAVIHSAQGGQPAALADGEFVIPARVVSEIGNGSSEAGARKLYAMMDRIENMARHAKRGKPSGADKELKKLA